MERLEPLNKRISERIERERQEDVRTPLAMGHSRRVHKTRIVRDVIGTMTQFPLRLGWALTIHKSQGLTLRHVCLDFGHKAPWAHGQTYVALSRCTGLDGLFLKAPISDSNVIVDDRILDFLNDAGLGDSPELDGNSTSFYAPRASETSTGSKEELLELLETSKDSFFITGPAGSGKSTLIREFVNNTEKNSVIVTFTGIAAINVGGQTINSFFRIPPFNSKTREAKPLSKEECELYRSIDIILIDEISMVRADLFDEMDERMREAKQNDSPFGGVRMLLFGDYYQLPPIDDVGETIAKGYGTEYAFSSNAYRSMNIKNIKLLKIHRQKEDSIFLTCLNAIRTGTRREQLSSALAHINARFGVTPQETAARSLVTLTTTRQHAKQINETMLGQLSGEEYHYSATVTGKFPIKENRIPAELDLVLKAGARVIFTQNDPNHQWVNGSRGIVTKLTEDSMNIKLDDGTLVSPNRFQFEMFEHKLG
ncbi:MAG: AAA family ATPase [Candidatus Burarchaeum sp.]|nr:AAA family ATPase [Candidatus Burarchaeum sp.]MDO8339492.1 AAA family ATPase [Candidatus Burarchaeum sp.]